MHQRRSIRFFAAAACVSTAVVLTAVHERGICQEEATAPDPAKVVNAEPKAAPAAMPDKVRVRLPPYYTRVVDDKQREQIYAIQRECAPSIEALKTQLAALVKQRNDKIEGVLTPEQRKEVERLREEAKAKRKAKAAKAG